jgi:hypothetical protein
LAASCEPHAGLLAAEISIDKATLMRKFINASLALVMMFGGTAVFSGCGEESGVKTDTKITAPDGSQTRERADIKVDKSGPNPPMLPSETKKP